MKITEGYMPFKGFKTYYRIVGENTEGKKPLVLLHGGPGSTHNYFEVLDKIAESGRQVIMYDQTKLWEKEQKRRISYMSEVDQKALLDAVNTGDYSSKEYNDALERFMEMYCAGEVTEDSPECLRRPKKSGSEAYIVGWGQNEFSPTGTLSGYEFTDRLHEIKEPCLVTSGAIDLCSPYIAKTMYDRIPNSKWELFEYSRHMPFVEENEKYIKVLTEWLNAND
ncbi:MAG: alpha/beta hydrolase [Clostridioides difficile]|nr:alpha/beta hydrolase [Clostridioides difficile]